MTPADAFVDALDTFDDASRLTARFDIFDHYVRDWIRTLSTEQNRLHADFALFFFELTNAFVSSRFGPLLLPGTSTANGSTNGRAFRLYYQLQREARRIRESCFQLAEYLVDFAEFREYHLGETLAAVQLTDCQADVYGRQCEAVTAASRYCETATQNNFESRHHLWFFR